MTISHRYRHKSSSGKPLTAKGHPQIAPLAPNSAETGYNIPKVMRIL
ncbi:MAG: hypothetical protein AAFR26_10775 [Cyanobacteria bacterium J06626_4]